MFPADPRKDQYSGNLLYAEVRLKECPTTRRDFIACGPKGF